MSNRIPALVILITLAGFALRLHNLTAVPLRGDEAFSVQYWARLPLTDSLATIATIEPHPFLNYALFRAWGLAAGTGEFAMRYLPALSSLIGIPALYALGKRIGGGRTGLLAALLWAFHPYALWHAQDVRNYALWSGLSAVALWLGLVALPRARPRDWLLYAAVSALAANIYYFELLLTAAFGLYALLTYPRRWRWILPALAVPFLTAGLSFAILQGGLMLRGGYGGTTGPFELARLPSFLVTLTFGNTLPAAGVSWLWFPLLLILLAGLFRLWQQNRRTALFLASAAFLPLLFLCLLSLRFRIFAPQYILSTAPAYTLMVAALVALPLSPRWQGIRLVPLVAWLFFTIVSLNNYFNDPIYVKAHDWRAVTSYLRQHVQPDDLVIQLAADASFGYYYDAPADEEALPARPEQPATDITAALEARAARYQSIWLVGQTFPDWPNAGVVENWMDANMQPVLREQAGDLRVWRFLPWEVAPDEISDAPLATFSDVAELVGVQVFKPPQPGGNLTVWLYWRVSGQTETPLKVFVHLAGGVNPATGTPLWSQDDRYPQNGRISTSDWQPGALYRDVYSLPLAAVPPGDYRLQVGLYNPETNSRLPVNEGDSYLAAPVQLP